MFVYAVHLNDRMEWVGLQPTEELCRAEVVEFLRREFHISSSLANLELFTEKFNLIDLDDGAAYTLAIYIGATE